MPFRFPLEAVLRFRRGVEHQHELRLSTANQHLERVRRFVEQTERKIRETEERRAQQLSAGMTGVELQVLLISESGMRAQIPEMQRELARIKALRDQQQRIYQQARWEREILERLRLRQLREYERDAERRKQRQLDDLFLQRQTYVRQSLLHSAHPQPSGSAASDSHAAESHVSRSEDS